MPRSRVTLKDLIGAGLLRPGQELQLHAREEIRAKVTAQGTLVYRATEYASPSSAATAIRGISTNGWTAWRTRGNAGRTLSDLRKEVLGRMKTK
jgi:Restriction Enzyme Adenine Methylase Associated